MDIATVIAIGKEAMKVTMLIAMPILIVSLIAGLLVSIFQAVTQIQEMTLTFIPKIIATAVTVIFLAPWMTKLLVNYVIHLYSSIPTFIK
ncbi:flagellar biosynthesis protein FliQ [Hippea maritima]|uniref:Flagellar biosynthetic protein FliQ n=1 Tax=Hippea maritima (strain ATCC 700847 / DSM 10411 / MH2) TaxID=760142 RepID=F2LVQ8_HIPMA|nr:flagellar biosynthesis protein FliQ [Hippea maritima]AEA33842.1 flagellar biosynthetic protein FliQ [Hippea maritima DSM 10411]